MNEANNRPLALELHLESTLHGYATVTISPTIVNLVYREAIQSQQIIVHAQGYSRGTTPLEYIETNLKSTLTEHVKEFLLNFWVINFVYEELRKQKIVIAGLPRLYSIDVNPPDKAIFTFEVSLAPQLQLLEWHYFPFKTPKRKNYKDLDRQVDLFIKEEKDNLKKNNAVILNLGDWVHFDITLADSNNKPYENIPKESLWLRLGEEEVDSSLCDLFLEKKINDHFYSKSSGLQEYFSSQLATNYNFGIKINDTVKNSYFCLEQFKKHFRLKSNKETQQKLIEIFSYRNDISLRRSIAEESLKLLLTKHKFDIPHHLVLRQQQILLDIIQTNPDYHVYRAQKDFQMRLGQLAEKQAKEAILIDHIAYYEDLDVADQDLKGYINLMQRPRTKEFIYFDPPLTKYNGQESPISTPFLKQNCMREKTLNHIIHHLIKQ